MCTRAGLLEPSERTKQASSPRGDSIGHDPAEVAHALDEAARDVFDDAADLEVARVHALARGPLEEVEDRLALAEAVPEHRDRAEVERARAQPDEGAHDPVELVVDDA